MVSEHKKSDFHGALMSKFVYCYSMYTNDQMIVEKLCSFAYEEWR